MYDNTDEINSDMRGGVAQWVARLTRNVKVTWVCAPSNAPVVSLCKKHLPLLLSTGWFQERIRAN